MNNSTIYSELDSLVQSHPNFVTLWKHYIELKQKSLDTALEACRDNIANIISLDMKDLNAIEINLLISLSKTLSLK